MHLTDAAAPALNHILAAPAPEGTVEFTLTGLRTGEVIASKPSRPGRGDVIINYAGDSYDLYVGADHVSGAMHTLRRVLLTRLCHIAARNPANMW